MFNYLVNLEYFLLWFISNLNYAIFYWFNLKYLDSGVTEQKISAKSFLNPYCLYVGFYCSLKEGKNLKIMTSKCPVSALSMFSIHIKFQTPQAQFTLAASRCVASWRWPYKGALRTHGVFWTIRQDASKLKNSMFDITQCIRTIKKGGK